MWIVLADFEDMTTLKIGFVADPIVSFNPEAETTFFLMHEVCQRGYECYIIELPDLMVIDSTPKALAKRVFVDFKNNQFTYKCLSVELLELSHCNALFLRKDPPFDMTYFDHLSLLELIEDKTLMINQPSGIKKAPEKIFPHAFKGVSPETLIAMDKNLIYDFVHKHKTAILKPLNLSGGRGIVKATAGDASLLSIIDILTSSGTNYIIAQKFIPAALKGDKRIILLDGKILGSFLRVPNQKDFRANLHSGGSLKKCPPTKKDKLLAQTLAPKLKAMGLYFVGIDLIGDKITEINVTSPMGLREINSVTKIQSQKLVIDWMEKKLISF